MTGLLKGKVAVVTGGSKGIGYSIAERFTKEGAKVVISSRNKEELEVAANELGSDCFAVDVSDSKSVLSLKEWLVAANKQRLLLLSLHHLKAFQVQCNGLHLR